MQTRRAAGLTQDPVSMGLPSSFPMKHLCFLVFVLQVGAVDARIDGHVEDDSRLHVN